MRSLSLALAAALLILSALHKEAHAADDPAPQASPCAAKDAGTVLGEFLGVPPRDASPEALRTLAWQRGFLLEFLLATVPDPGLGFDGAVEAIVRGLEASDYTPDRFWLPWPAAGAANADPTCPERNPGVLLFLHGPKDTLPDAALRRRLLLLSLVGETPTAGLHKPAFLKALRDVQGLAPLGRGKDAVRLVGPSFSGSAVSLQTLLRALPDLDFRIVSGRATDRHIKDMLESPTVRYHTTTLPDDTLADAFYAYLVDTLGAREKDIAIITESSTAYGRALIGRYEEVWVPGQGPRRPRLVLPMPLHISRLQRAWERDRRQREKGQGQGTAKGPPQTGLRDAGGAGISRALPYEPETGATDRPDLLPPLSSDTTLSEDRALGTILTTIFDEHIRYVGLFATDVRDKIFLAQQIRKFAPDVALFTFESDLLYTHPDLREDLKGMMVVSTYPLFTRNQQWSYPFRGWRQRLQFGHGSDQGTYNATVALLGRRDQLLEYSPPLFIDYPASVPRRPVPWVSAVGIDALFPLATLPVPAAKDGDRDPVLSVEDAQPPDALHSYPYQQGTLSLTLFFLCLLCLAHAAGYLRKHHGPVMPPEWDEPLPWRLFDVFRRPCFTAGARHESVFAIETRRQPRYILALFLAQLGALPALLTLHLLQFSGKSPGRLSLLSPSFLLALLGAATVGVLLYTTLNVARQVIVRGLGRPAPERYHEGLRWPRWGLEAGFSGIVGMALLVPMLGLGQQLREHVNLVLALRRSALPSYGLSPVVPLLTLFCGVYLWGHHNLRRIRLLERMADIQEDLLDELAGDLRLRRKVEAVAQSLRSPTLRFIGAGLLLSGLISVTIFSGLMTLEWWPINHLFRFLFALVSVFIWFSFWRFLSLWGHFRGFLNLLGHGRMAQSFDRMPVRFARGLGVLLLEELPELTKREALALHWNLLKNHLGRLEPELEALLVSVPDATALRRLLDELKALAAPGRDPEAGDVPPQNPAKASLLVIQILKHFWDGRPLKGDLSGRPPVSGGSELHTTNTADLYMKTLPDSLHLWLRLLEDFIAVQVVAYIDRLFPHLRNALVFSTLGMLVMLLSISTYPFQPEHFLLMLVWFMIFTIAGLTFFVLIQMNRDEVLSRVAKSEPGKLSWDRRFMAQLLVYVAVPVVSLLAAQFPAVHQSVFFWLEPALKILK